MRNLAGVSMSRGFGRSLPWAILALALLARIGVWLLLDGPVIRGDGPAYVEWARALADRNFSGFADYPLHQLYPMLIAPAFAAGIPLAPYLLALHFALSLATVLFLYAAVRQFAGELAAGLVGLIAAVYPALLLWFPYVLSETPFFFFVALYVWLLARILSSGSNRTPQSFLILGAAGTLMLLTRPVSLAILASSGLALALVLLTGSIGASRARLVTLVTVVALVSTATAVLVISEPLRGTLLRNPTVAQSLWLSTRYSSSSFRNWQPIAEQNRTLAERFAGRPDDLWDYKVTEAMIFVRTEPAAYIGLAVQRFTSFWFPAIFADGWSRSHRAFDLLLSLALYAGVVVSLFGRAGPVRWTLASMALALGLLSSLSQIDTDGRYRVPAEVILLPLVADGYARVLLSGWHRWSTRFAHTDHSPTPA